MAARNSTDVWRYLMTSRWWSAGCDVIDLFSTTAKARILGCFSENAFLLIQKSRFQRPILVSSFFLSISKEYLTKKKNVKTADEGRDDNSFPLWAVRFGFVSLLRNYGSESPGLNLSGELVFFSGDSEVWYRLDILRHLFVSPVILMLPHMCLPMKILIP